MKYILIKNLP